MVAFEVEYILIHISNEIIAFSFRMGGEKMNKEVVFVYTFADGYRCWCAGFDKAELQHAEAKHGKLVNVQREY